MKVDVSIVGATGYAGSELLRILVSHPYVRHITAASHSHVGKQFSSQYPNLRYIYDEQCAASRIPELAASSDVLFLSLPHGIATTELTASVIDRCKVIDLSADFRMKDADVYEKWYKTDHGGRAILEQAVYGLCELHRCEIARAAFIANPGCYTTCSILTLAPLLQAHLIDERSIIIDAKSGVSGAGRNEKLDSLFCECNETIKAYGVGTHRHIPEIEEQLSMVAGKNITVSFAAHLVPMNRGILATCYANLAPHADAKAIDAAFKDSYGNERFIRLLGNGVLPETRWVKDSNFCDIGYVLDTRNSRIVVCGAIDNLVKGAAGQAVQNMNIVCGFAEDCGLEAIPAFPM